jgi:hypothetical protein
MNSVFSIRGIRGLNARIVALLACLAIGEATLLSPFIWFLLPPPPNLQPLAQVGLVWVVLFVMAAQWRWLAQRGLKLGVQRGVMALWLIGLFVIAEIDVFLMGDDRTLPDLLDMLPAFLGALILWWRGTALGNNDLLPRSMDLHFQLGALMLIGTGALTLFMRTMDPVLLITSFFLASLFTLPLSNLELTHTHQYGRHAPMTRQWWLWVAGTVVGVMLIGIIVTSVLTGRNAAELLATFISLMLLPLFLLLSLIPVAFFDWLIAIIRRIVEGMSFLSGLLPPQDTAQPQVAEPAGAGIVLPAEANFALGIVVFAVLVIVLLSLIQQARRYAAAPQGHTGDLDGALPKNERDETGGAARRFGLGSLRRWLAAMTIRRLYSRAVHEAAKRGQRRETSQTPYDFLPRMQHAFPSAEGDALAITQAYIAAHYGEVPDSQDALNALKVAWERMRGTSAPPMPGKRG